MMITNANVSLHPSVFLLLHEQCFINETATQPDNKDTSGSYEQTENKYQ